jgi:hypothetical protein
LLITKADSFLGQTAIVKAYCHSRFSQSEAREKQGEKTNQPHKNRCQLFSQQEFSFDNGKLSVL